MIKFSKLISYSTLSICAYAGFSSHTLAKENAPTFDPVLYEKIKMLSPEESITKIQLPEGYSLVPVLSEPHITEPVACAFDGNGRMFVVEMNTYMQDANAKNEFDQTSRISMHEDTNGDGKYDKHSVFIDKLLLPRMVLPLEDGVVVGVTNTLDLWLYKDTTGDGIADTKTKYHTGGPRGGNMEHQPSGLTWSMDNWVYTTYTTQRLKMGKDKVISTEPTHPNQGQWGLTQDNHGKPWFVSAGHEIGPINYQHPIVYGRSTHFKDQEEDGFREVFPICDFPDVQGGERRLKPLEGHPHLDCGKVLNHFTATCGQDIYRGDRLPKDLVGDLLFAEPTGRLIRRTSVKINEGITHISNANPKSEFIRSTDPNFRPVNMNTAPDGTIYIVDMYRGIIQEGAWTAPGSYLRKIIDQYGFDKNIQHGRIYRLVHKDHQRGPKPSMIGASSSELVTHLAHPNGWWRDTAQKFLVLRKDASTAEALTNMAVSNESYLARMHALWTLEGSDLLTPEHISTALEDTHPQVRRAAIRVAETLIKSKHASATSLIASIESKVEDSDPEVVMQVLLTSNLLRFPNNEKTKAIAARNNSSEGVMQTLVGLGGNSSKFAKLPKVVRQQIKQGKEIYLGLCSSCHGEDGMGTKAGDMLMAPPFASSATVNGNNSPFINIVLHGLTGPVEGKNYTAPMVAMSSQNDKWIADVTTYIKNSFGNDGGSITPNEVASNRATYKDRKTPWTIAELNTIYPHLLSTEQWKVTASHNNSAVNLATDGKLNTRYASNAPQQPGMWYQIEFPQQVELSSVKVDTTPSARDYPTSYTAETSNDGSTWNTVADVKKHSSPIIHIDLTGHAHAKAKFFRITNQGSNKRLYWSIHEVRVLAK